MSFPNEPDRSRLDHVALRVRDLDVSRSFYLDVLMFDEAEPTTAGRHDESAVRCSAPGSCGRSGVELIQGRSMSPSPTLDHFSFELGCVQDVREVHQRAIRGHTRTTAPAVIDGRLRLFVFDPDGHKIEIYARREAARGEIDDARGSADVESDRKINSDR